MTPQLRQLFSELAPLSPAARAAELDRLAPDAAVRRQLENLLAADALTDGMIDSPIRTAAASISSQALGLQFGVWRTTELLGQGGMGVVYRAERVDGTVEQTAAIKLLYRGLETEDLLNRFQRERSILARLSHPNIARFLDAGATDEGLPWFAMEFVDGIPLDRYCQEKLLGPEACARMLVDVCAAVQHAHGHLVIHRDIKPDNIQVTDAGTPVLLDFGIAQVLGEARAGAPVTRAMTPDYASPEQLRGEPATTATDVYLLGAVLRTLLPGTPPGDLGNILARATHEEPTRRYATPTELAGDLNAWLNGLPVAATPDSFFYRTRRFVGRHRWPVAITATAFLVTAASAAVAAAQAVAARNQARLAQKHFRDVRTLANTFLFDFEAAIHNLDGATKGRELVVTTAQKYLENLSAQDSGDPVLQRELAEAWTKLARLQGGQTNTNTGHRADAVGSFRKALELRRALGDDRTADPGLRSTYLVLTSNLVNTLMNLQRAPEALPVTAAAVASAEAFLRDAPTSREANRSVYVAHHSRSILCLVLSDSACATASADRALAVIGDWGTKHPGDRRIELDTASAEHYVGQTALVYGNYRAARETSRSMVARMERFAKQWAPTPESRRITTFAWQMLGLSLAASSEGLPAQPEEAVAALRKSVLLTATLRDKDPNNILAAEDLMLSKSVLGGVLAEFRPREAIGLLQPLRDEMLAFVQKDSGNFNVKKTLADAHNDLGRALLKTRSAEAALREHMAAQAVSDAILAGTPEDAVSRKARAISLLRGAAALAALKRVPAALAGLEQAEQTLGAMAKAAPADASVQELSGEVAQVREEIRKKFAQ